MHIGTVDPITGIANGSPKTIDGLGLKYLNSVALALSDGTVIDRPTIWDLDNLTTYDPSKLCEQTFDVYGTCILPEYIQPHNTPLIFSVSITVNAGTAAAPTASLNEQLTPFTSNQSTDLHSTTANSNIYYTLDGTKPDLSNGTLYTEAIAINGVEGKDVTTTVKAITEKDGILSDVSEFVYTVNLPDTTAPTSRITVGSNNWNTFLHDIAFDHFFKEMLRVTIISSDMHSDIKSTEYYISDHELTKDEASAIKDWKIYTGPFDITANSKLIIYAKATDQADNTVIINSSGIILYSDSTAVTTTLEYIKNVKQSLSAIVTLNGNSIADIKNGQTILTKDTDYTISGDTIFFANTYLDSLDASTTPYTLTINYNPMNSIYIPGEYNEAPTATTMTLTVSDANIIYKITSGAGSSHQLNTEETMTLICSGELESLTGIFVDEKLTDPKHYTTTSGSTILTFNAAYLNTLSVGSHTVKFVYKNGSAEGIFKITQAKTPGNNKPSDTTSTTPNKTTSTSKPAPSAKTTTTTRAAASTKPSANTQTATTAKTTAVQTGDQTSIALILALLAVSTGIIIWILRRKKHN